MSLTALNVASPQRNPPSPSLMPEPFKADLKTPWTRMWCRGTQKTQSLPCFCASFFGNKTFFSKNRRKTQHVQLQKKHAWSFPMCFTHESHDLKKNTISLQEKIIISTAKKNLLKQHNQPFSWNSIPLNRAQKGVPPFPSGV